MAESVSSIAKISHYYVDHLQVTRELLLGHEEIEDGYLNIVFALCWNLERNHNELAMGLSLSFSTLKALSFYSHSNSKTP